MLYGRSFHVNEYGLLIIQKKKKKKKKTRLYSDGFLLFLACGKYPMVQKTNSRKKRRGEIKYLNEMKNLS